MELVESIKLLSWYWSINRLKLHLDFTMSGVGICGVV